MVEDCIFYQFATDCTISTHLAEEEGGGKALLLEKGAYEGIDVCVMYVRGYIDFYTLTSSTHVILNAHTNRTHPVSGPPSSALIISSLARQSLDVEYHGKPYV